MQLDTGRPLESNEPSPSIEKIRTGSRTAKLLRNGVMALVSLRKRGYARSVVSSEGGR